MARPGYIQARNALYEAKDHLDRAEAELAAVDTLKINGQDLIPKIREIHRADRTRWVAEARVQVAEAEKAFAAFSDRSLDTPRVKRKYFDIQVFMCLSMTKTMADAFTARLQEDGVSKSELVRQALKVYLFDFV